VRTFLSGSGRRNPPISGGTTGPRRRDSPSVGPVVDDGLRRLRLILERIEQIARALVQTAFVAFLVGTVAEIFAVADFDLLERLDAV
jgi:hypothetical protein